MIDSRLTARALAEKHLWNSWFWGLGLAIGLLAAGLTIYTMQESGGHLSSMPGPKGWLILLISSPPLTAVPLGVPSLLGAFIRRRGVEWAFATAVSRNGLAWRLAVVFEGSVLLLLLGYLLLLFAFGRSLSWQSVFETVRLFFGLSMPWLVSSVLVALKLWPGRLPEVASPASDAQAAPES